MGNKEDMYRLLATGVVQKGYLKKLKDDPKAAASEIGINVDDSTVGNIKTVLNKLDNDTFNGIDNLSLGNVS